MSAAVTGSSPRGRGCSARDGQRHALGEAADARGAAHCEIRPSAHSAHAPQPYDGSQATALPDQAAVDAASHVLHDARVLVAEHERRRPREQPLRRVDVGAADAGGAHGDQRLAGTGRGLGRLVEGEAATAPPRRDFHGRPAPLASADTDSTTSGWLR